MNDLREELWERFVRCDAAELAAMNIEDVVDHIAELRMENPDEDDLDLTDVEIADLLLHKAGEDLGAYEPVSAGLTATDGHIHIKPATGRFVQKSRLLQMPEGVEGQFSALVSHFDGLLTSSEVLEWCIRRAYLQCLPAMMRAREAQRD